MVFATRTRGRTKNSLCDQLFRTVKLTLIISFVTCLPFFAAYAYPTLKFIYFQLAPTYWKSLCHFFTPPYLFLLLNFIIATLVLSASYHGGNEKVTITLKEAVPADSVEESCSAMSENPEEAVEDNSPAAEQSCSSNSQVEETPLLTSSPAAAQESFHEKPDQETQISSEEGKAMEEIWKNIKELKRKGNSKPQAQAASPLNSEAKESGQLKQPRERPLLSSRFTHHRRPGKGSSDPKLLRKISRNPSRKTENMEATWKVICEKRRPPLNRHLRKAESWDGSSLTKSFAKSSAFNVLPPPPRPILHGTEPTSTCHNAPPPTPPRLPLSSRRREPSMSSEELNKRVEAFIAQFNKQIRLQRQESILRSMKKTGRTAA